MDKLVYGSVLLTSDKEEEDVPETYTLTWVIPILVT